MTLTRTRLALLLAGAAVASSAHAVTGEETFSYSGQLVADLTWTTVGSTTSFALTLLGAPSPGAFASQLDFNGPSGTYTDTDTTTVSTGTYGPFSVGSFDYTWKVAFANKPKADRLTLGETATWTIDNAGPFMPDMPILTLGHFTNEGQRVSICGVSVVPEPASGALLLAGLGGLGLLARRRRTR